MTIYEFDMRPIALTAIGAYYWFMNNELAARMGAKMFKMMAFIKDGGTKAQLMETFEVGEATVATVMKALEIAARPAGWVRS